MAIHNQEVNQVEGGFAKHIDDGAMRMLLDNFQKDQYSYPEKSTIRELASNAIDATREREVAISILSGKTKMEDHYVHIEGTEYKDSKFDPSYYDLKWLSPDPNIYITYKEGSALEKDEIIIRDNGIGLGGSRLLGYFSLAYSTKRLSRFGLGKFGMGAKSPLSTGVPYYVVKNRYNGRETWWTVYSYQVEPSVPKFDTKTGKENGSFDIGNGTVTYFIPTTEPNGLEVIINVKKHNKQKYIDAVKSQLLYFENIVFRIEAANKTVETIPVNSPILYEDDVMILSDNQFYTKPHILVNRVNYGLIDFQELELEDKIGNISIKLKPEEVSVSPNRERVIWDEMTANAIKRRFQEVQKSAEKLLQGELQHTDFMKWLKACITIKNKIGAEQNNGIVARLARLVSLDNYEPVYKLDADFRLNRYLFAGMKVRKTFIKSERHGSTHKLVVDRVQAGFSDLVDGDLPVFIQQKETSWVRDRYLLDDIYQSGFITIMLNETEIPPLPDDATEDDIKNYQWKKQLLGNHAIDTALEMKIYDASALIPGQHEEAFKKVTDRWRRINQYILASEGIQFYDTIEVPQSYTDRSKTTIQDGDTEDSFLRQEEEVQTKEARLSAEARRKLQGETILFTPRVRYGLDREKSLYEWHKLEIPVADIDKWNEPEVYYSSDDNASLLQLAAFITRPGDDPRSTRKDPGGNDQTNATTYLTAFLYGPEVKLIKVAQNRVRYYQDFKHINQFFAEVNKSKVLTMSNSLIKWNTARYIHQYLPQLRFLTNFASFHPDNATLYKNLVTYHSKYYRAVQEHAGKIKEVQQIECDSMIKHLDKVAELQFFVSEHADDPVAIAKLVTELFGDGLDGKVSDGCAIDMNIRNTVHQLLDYAEPLHVMLNQMPVLTGDEVMSRDDESGVVLTQIPEELETEIRNFITFKRG